MAAEMPPTPEDRAGSRPRHMARLAQARDWRARTGRPARAPARPTDRRRRPAAGLRFRTPRQKQAERRSRPRPGASPDRRRARPRRSRTATRRARRGRRGRSARRRRWREPSRACGDFVLYRAGELRVLESVERERNELDLPVEGMAPPDVDAVGVDLDDVVTGSSVPTESQRRHRSGIDDEKILEPPHVRNVLVTRQDEPHAGALEALDRVARVVDDVPLPAGPGYGQQVVVQDEDLQVRRVRGELLLHPAIAPAPELAVVEIGLARVDRDDRHGALAPHRVALAEHLL